MQLITKYSDFSKGDAGWTDKSRVTPGFFVGENVVPFRDGSIGPRSGVLDLGLLVDNGGGAVPVIGSSIGSVYNCGYIDLATGGNEYVWIHAGTGKLCRAPVFGGLGTYQLGQQLKFVGGTFDAVAPTGGLADACEKDPRVTIFTVNGNRSYSVDWSAGANGTSTPLTGSPGGACVEVFNEFLVVAHTVAHPNRVQFSAPGNYNSWPAANFFDVGASGVGQPSIVAIRRLRDSLLIWTDLGQLFVVTGRLGSSETVREFMPGDQMSGPGGPHSIIRTRDGTAWWTRRQEEPFGSTEEYGLPTAVPVGFTGGQRTEVVAHGGYLQQPDHFSNRTSKTTGSPGREEKSLVLMDQSVVTRALILRNDAWSRHKFGEIGAFKICTGSRGDLFMVNNNATVIQVWLFEFERPPYKYDTVAGSLLPWSVDDGGFAIDPPPYFATPEFRTANNSNTRVDRVEVLFTAHATGDSVNNHFDVFLQMYDHDNANEYLDSAHGANEPADKDDNAGALVTGGVTVACTPSFDEAPDAGSGLGGGGPRDIRHRRAFYPPTDGVPAPAFRVLIRAMRGVSIREINVYGTMEPEARP